jgi:hypothetical protein
VAAEGGDDASCKFQTGISIRRDYESRSQPAEP